MKAKLLVCGLLFLLAFSTARSLAAPPAYFLKLPGVAGGSLVRHHEQEIIITGFQYPSISGSDTTFQVQKLVDSASPDLFNAVTSGTTFATATFSCETEGPRSSTRIFKMDFTNLTVDNVQMSDGGIIHFFPAEKVMFSFSQVVITYYTRNGATTTVTIPYNP